MNTALVSDEILNGKPASVLDAMLRMEENGYSFENYKPLSDDCMFLWHKDTNRILLVKVTDGGYSVEFPEGYEEIEINDSLIGPSNAFQTLYLVDIGTDKESVESLLSGEDAVVVDQNGAPAQRALENATESKPLTVDLSAISDNAAVVRYLSSVAAIVNGTFEDPLPLEYVTLKLPETVNVEGSIWVPIGDSLKSPFAGSVVGAEGGTTISGLNSEGYIGPMDKALVLASGQVGVTYGFIGAMSSGTVKNITLTDVTIDMSASGVEMGGLIGLINGQESVAAEYAGAIVIENCQVGTKDDGSYVKGQSKVGGIVGAIEPAARQSVLIQNCTNYAAVTATSTGNNVRAGGIVGAWLVADGGGDEFDEQKMIECVNYGAVSAQNFAAGLCAHLYCGYHGPVTVYFEGCQSNGTVTVTSGEKTGGHLVAYWSVSQNIVVEDCSVNGTTIVDVGKEGWLIGGGSDSSSSATLTIIVKGETKVETNKAAILEVWKGAGA